MVSANRQGECYKDGLEQGRGEADNHLTEFEEKLQKAIDDTLALLGSNRKHAFSMRLKDEFNLEPTRLAQHPEALSSALDEILGPAGQIVGRAIATKAAAAYGSKLSEDHTLKYADLIRNLKQIVFQKATRDHSRMRISVPNRVIASETDR
jgi:hypothetical protein